MVEGGRDSGPLMIGQGMPVDPLQGGVSGMPKPLDDVLIRDAGSMQGTGHVVPVVVEAAVREAVALQEAVMPGCQGVRMDVAHVSLFPDQIYDLRRHLHIPVGFVGLRDDGKFTISAIKVNGITYGHLKSGVGWVSLQKAERPE